MSIRLVDEYINHTPADANYPQGSFKNTSTPTGIDGTPLEKKWGNDIIGFLQRLLFIAGITPSGAPDNALVSDYFNAMQKIFTRFLICADTGIGGAYALAPVSGAPATEYFNGMIVAFKSSDANSGAATVNVSGLGAKALTTENGTALTAGSLKAGEYILATYNLAGDRFELVFSHYYRRGGSNPDDIPTLSSPGNFSGKNFNQDGGIGITDTGNTTSEFPLFIQAPSIADSGNVSLLLGKNWNTLNNLLLQFMHAADQDAANEARLVLSNAPTGFISINGAGNVGIGKTATDGYKLDTNGPARIGPYISIQGLDANEGGEVRLSGGSSYSLTTIDSYQNQLRFFANKTPNLDVILSNFGAGNANLSVGGSLGLLNGVTVNEISTDGTLADDSDLAVPTEKAVKTAISAAVSPFSPSMVNSYESTLINIPASGGATLRSIDLGTVTAGDFFILSGQGKYTVSGAKGEASLRLGKLAGTATVASTGAGALERINQGVQLDISGSAWLSASAPFQVTASGTLTVWAEGRMSIPGATATVLYRSLTVTWLKKQ